MEESRNVTILLALIQHQHQGIINEGRLLCEYLMTNISGAEMFKVLNPFLKNLLMNPWNHHICRALMLQKQWWIKLPASRRGTNHGAKRCQEPLSSSPPHMKRKDKQTLVSLNIMFGNTHKKILLLLNLALQYTFFNSLWQKGK